MLQHAKRLSGNVSQTCRFFGVSRALYYFWKKRYEKNGLADLRDLPRRPHHIRFNIPPEGVSLILRIREERRYRMPLLQAPGRSVQLDVKFVPRVGKARQRFYQFTAIDEATRFRVLRLPCTEISSMDQLAQNLKNAHEFPVFPRREFDAHASTSHCVAYDGRSIHFAVYQFEGQPYDRPQWRQV